VGSESRAADSSRFDSGAFSDEELRQSERHPVTEHSHDEPDDGPAFAPGAIHRAVEQKPASSQTADLLEALRRRRGEREAAAFADEDDPILPSSGGIHLVGTQLPTFDEADDGLFGTAPQPLSGPPRSIRKGRATMPSWDEIVFGARPEDDPA
jgi:hypothetical protein